MTYQGCIGSVQFSGEDNVFFGKVEGINDLVTFEGETVQEFKDAFRFMVVEHIKDCETENIPVETSYKGSLHIDLTPDLHRRAAIFAKRHGTTLNTFVKESIERRLEYAY